MAQVRLSALVRELRARVEVLEDSDWSPAVPPSSAAGRPASVSSTAAPAAVASASTAADPGVEHRFALLRESVLACRKCPLGAQRLNPAFGVGDVHARVLFVGEGPGFEEDRRGEPFVGKAGQLLDRILAAIGLSRETVYIANVVKCHPMADPSDPSKRGNDRPPSPEETEACRGYLEEQIRLIRPRAMVALGASAAKALLRTTDGITRLRGTWREYRLPEGGESIPVMPTYHPAALLRDESLKRDAWEDMKALKKLLEAAP
ncbi:MAG: uracil-DNA glycosylase [Elusimicrobiota bacterium]|jgi:DNA polymerase